MPSVDFSPLPLDEQGKQLALHLPQGQLWANAFNEDSNMGKLIQGLAVELYRFEVLTKRISVEIDPRTASDLILEWERAVGIPDICFGRATTIEQRREQLLLKLTSYGGVQSAEDFERVARVFGFEVTVSNGWEHGVFPMTFPLRFYKDLPAATHTILVQFEEQRSVFPLDFPIQFTSGLTSVIECIFRRLKPANCQIIFRFGD